MKRPCRCTHLEDAHAAGAKCRFCHCEAFDDATTEHTAGLRDLALHALLIAKLDLTRTGTVNPFFVFREKTGNKLRLNMPKGTAAIMNNGRAKDLLFATIRETVQEQQIEAVVFVTDAWFGKSTEKALVLPKDEFLAKTRERAFQTAVDEGLVKRSEAISVSVQTPTRAMVVNQLYERDDAARKITYQEVVVMEMGTDEFGGRQKMYGDFREENLR